MPEQPEVKIPAHLLEALEALPPRYKGGTACAWTPEQDAILLAYWPTRAAESVAKIVGYCAVTCRKRYRELISRPSRESASPRA